MAEKTTGSGVTGLGAASFALSGLSGLAAGYASKVAARQAGLDAKVQELQRREELQDALAMQAVISAAGGRVGGVGSLEAIQKEDKARLKEDVSMLKAGAKAKQAGVRGAGAVAKYGAITSGLLSAAQTAQQAKKVK